MSKTFLMGNEAIGMGAIRAGVQVSAIRVRPSTEILETVAKHNPAISTGGMVGQREGGYGGGCGCRPTPVRDHGDDEAGGLKRGGADLIVSLAYGRKGGMVVVGGRSGPISSQTEQDTRHFAQFSKLPLFDPQLAGGGLGDDRGRPTLEKYHTPVLFRPPPGVPSRLRQRGKWKERVSRPAPEGFIKDSNKWVIYPRLR